MKITNLAPGAGKTTSALSLCTKLIKNSEKNKVTYITITNSAAGDAKNKINKTKILDEKQLRRLHIGTMHSYLLILLRASTDTRFIPSTKTYKIELFEDILPTKNIKNKDKFMSVYDATYPITTENGKKSRIIPMDLLLDYTLANDIKPDNNEYFVIDEFQDMYAREVNSLASMLNSNKVFLFGDTNQSIFSFRQTLEDDESINIDIPKISASQTYRLYQDSCDMLNRFLLIKKEFSLALGGTGYGTVKMTSLKKNKDSPSVSILPFESLYYNGIPNLFQPKPSINIEYPSTFIDSIADNNSFIIMHPYNSGARMHSKHAIDTFGKESIYSWYEQVGNSRMYKDFRYLLTGPEGITNLNQVFNIMQNTMYKVGYNVPSSGLSTLRKIATSRKRIGRVEKDKLTISNFKERMAIIGEGNLPLSYRLSKTANTKSNLAANLTIMSMLLNKGLRSYFNAVRLYFDKEKVKSNYSGGIFTVHAAKGMEAGTVLMDMSSGIHLSGGEYSAVEQTLNTIYVGLSRHQEKLFIISNYSAKRNMPLSDENPFMKNYNDVYNGKHYGGKYDQTERQNLLTTRLKQLSDHMMSAEDNKKFEHSNELITELIFAACDIDETQKVLASLKAL